MKRNLLVLGCMVMILSSCGKDPLEMGYPDMNAPITFNTYSQKSTKADTHNKLEDFYKTFKVYGWKSPTGAADSWTTVFNNVTVEYFGDDVNKHGDQLGYANEGVPFIYLSTDDPSYTPADEWKDFIYAPGTDATGWYYEGIRYFDNYKPYYLFMAYAPSRAGGVMSIEPNDRVFKIGDAANKITVEDTNLMATPQKGLAYAGYQYDYMTAGNLIEDHRAQLIFHHRLAKLNIELKVQPAFVDGIKKSKLTTILPVVVNEISIHKLNGTSYYDSSKDNATGYAEGYVSGWKAPVGEVEYKVTNIPLTKAGLIYADNDFWDEDNIEKFVDGYWVLERLLMPQTINKCALGTQMAAYDDAYMYVKYSVGDEAFQTYVALCNLFTEAPTLDLEGGNEYSISVVVGPDPVYFQVSVETRDDHQETFEF